MPIFFQQDIDHNTRLAIWKIEEEENFFTKNVFVQREITHVHKRKQHLAGRLLLRNLFPHFPLELIRIADTRKPFLDDEAYHFSISHCGDYAAVLVSTVNRVGIDIELIDDKINRISQKFLSPDDRKVLNPFFISTENVGKYLTLAWSCKEAIFKWYGGSGVDFRKHINLKSIVPVNENELECIYLFSKNEELYLDLHSVFFDDLCMSWVLT